AGSHLRIDTGVAVLVVGLALARIGKHFVGFVGFLEGFLSRLITRIAIGVVLHGEAAVSLFQLRLAGATLDTQHLVIITFCHKFPEPSNSYPPDTPTREQAPAQRSRLSRTRRGKPEGQATRAVCDRLRALPCRSQVADYLLSLTSSYSASTASAPDCASAAVG